MRSMIHDFKIQLTVITLLAVVAMIIVESHMSNDADNPILNEVCCYNDTIIYDRAGVYNDYIEIHNPTSQVMDISGFSISDKKYNLTRYTFPEHSFLEGGSYKVMWATDTPNEDWLSDQYYSYLGFSLHAGETVYLSNASGQVVDKVKIPMDIARDVSYSRTLDAGSIDEWGTASATPGEINATGVQVAESLLDTVVDYSVSSGFYEKPFWLEMTNDKDYDIYYTLDGSEPTVDSLKYNGPVWIDDISNEPNKYAGISNISLMEDVYIPDRPVEKINVIRAVAINDEGVRSRDSYATYLIGLDSNPGFEDMATISLITDPYNLFDNENGIYVTGIIWDWNKDKLSAPTSENWMFFAPANYSRRGLGWQRETSMQYFDTSGRLVYSQQVGLRTHGEWSRAHNQKSFNLIALPGADGNQYVCEGLFGQKETSLMLRTGGFRDFYATKLRDVLNQDLVADRNLGIQTFEPCQVFLNGEYWGLYNLQERIDASYFVSHYDVAADNIVVYKNYTIIVGEQEEEQLYLDVVDFAVENDLSQQEYYEQIQQMIDIQNYIDYYCFQIYVANCDSVGNNYGRWRVRETNHDTYGDGKWRWFLFDTDDSVGMVEGRTDADTDSFIEGNWQKNALGDDLFTALLQNEEFKEQFVTTFMDMANYNFEAGKVLDEIDMLANLYCSAAVMSHRRFMDENYSEDDYWDEISIVKDFYENRYDYITAYMKPDLSLTGDLTDVAIEPAQLSGGAVRLNTLTIHGNESFAGKYYSDYDISLHADAYEGYRFTGWEINGDIVSQMDIVLKLDKGYIIRPIWEKIS